ncbi:MAG: glycosyl transferase [Dehalococcoidia bacterium SM23_28_2]|nr:MAG: glycosyl transferase [Dehalococcoidia bacterium SM23_28_2]
MANVDVVIPVYNEEHVLAQSVDTLRRFLSEGFAHQWRILIADNASTDNTLAVAQGLAEKHADVASLHIPQKGRGRALKASWLGSAADVVSYMDVDLSTELEAFPPLIEAIASEGYEVSFGSRLSPASDTHRSLKRQFISRGYNLMIKALFFTRFSDAQCGFKAVSRRAVQELVPLIENNEWFFDTELLILAEKSGYPVKEIPVRWLEDPDTRVNIRKTVWEDIRGLARLRLRRPWRAVKARA